MYDRGSVTPTGDAKALAQRSDILSARCGVGAQCVLKIIVSLVTARKQHPYTTFAL